MEITDKTDVHNKTKVRKRFQKCFATLWSNIEKDKGQTVLSTQDKRLIKQQTKGEYLTVAAINKNLFPCKYNENKTTKTLETVPNAYVALFSILLLIWLRIYLYRAPKFLQARKSAPSLSIPKEFQTAGRKILSSSTLCMQTGMRSIEARVMRSAPI